MTTFMDEVATEVRTAVAEAAAVQSVPDTVLPGEPEASVEIGRAHV